MGFTSCQTMRGGGRFRESAAEHRPAPETQGNTVGSSGAAAKRPNIAQVSEVVASTYSLSGEVAEGATPVLFHLTGE